MSGHPSYNILYDEKGNIKQVMVSMGDLHTTITENKVRVYQQGPDIPSIKITSSREVELEFQS